MAEMRTYWCEICRSMKRPDQDWFLVVERGDMVRVLPWDNEGAQLTRVWYLCGMAHVRQFVLRWMTGRGLTSRETCNIAPDELVLSEVLESIQIVLEEEIRAAEAGGQSVSFDA